MVLHICQRCGKNFNHKGTFDRHVNKKKPCDETPKNNKYDLLMKKIEELETQNIEIKKEFEFTRIEIEKDFETKQQKIKNKMEKEFETKHKQLKKKMEKEFETKHKQLKTKMEKDFEIKTIEIKKDFETKQHQQIEKDFDTKIIELEKEIKMLKKEKENIKNCMQIIQAIVE